MSWYRRANQPGATYFFTVVTHRRRRFLTDALARDCLHGALEEIRKKHPFELEAICLLPNHLHCIWRLPEDDADFSTRWGGIKALFSFYYADACGSGKRAGQNAASKRHTGRLEPRPTLSEQRVGHSPTLLAPEVRRSSACGGQGRRSASRQRSGEAAFWQRRFWEHRIRDQADYARHMDYTHYNPVKHGLVRNVCDWPWSTFHRYVNEGIYDMAWGSTGMEWVQKFSTAGE